MANLDKVQETLETAYRLNLAGRFDAAINALDGLLADEPDNYAALQLKGSALMGLGRAEESERILKKGMALAPDDANSYGNLALLYRREGRLAEARQLLEKALALDPANLNLCLLYADVLEAQHEIVMATRFLAQCTARFPKRPELVKALCRLFVKLGDARNAIGAARRWLEIEAKSLDAVRNLAEVARHFARYPLASEQYRRLTELEPENRDHWLRFSEMLFECSQYSDAVDAFTKSVEGRKMTAEDHITLGRLQLHARRTEQAMESLEKGIALDPEIPEGHSSLGRIATIAGDRDRARDHLERALELDPDLAEAHFYYSRVAERAADDPVLERLGALLESDRLGDYDRINLGFALGNFYHKLGDYDRAFRHYQAANEAGKNLARAGGYSFDEDAESRHMRRMEEWYSSDLLEAAGEYGSPSEMPVFIIGMPRSGTTLLEQILGRHSRAEGMGEREEIGRLHREFLRAMGDGGPDRLLPLFKEKAAGWAEHYLEAAAGLSGVDRVIDKMPINFLYAGFVRVLFPRARIIHIHRNPLDTCISIYTNKFSKAYEFARHLETLGAYYRLYHRLMAHWRKVMTGPYLEIKYEDLVADQEAQSRRLIDFLGLEWEDACLEFYKTDKEIYTFSSSQVRKPMTASSIDRWRHYADHLGPLREALGDLAAVD